MVEYGMHHLFSVLPWGAACLAIFGRDGYHAMDRDGRAAIRGDGLGISMNTRRQRY